jgi:hypothetical protein
MVTGRSCATAVALVISAATAAADGALVVGVPPGGLRAGFAHGRTWNYDTSAEAIKRAFAICREEAQQQGFAPSQCKLVESFARKCAAVAMDMTNYWAGWAVSPGRDAAEQAALANCRRGGSNCKLHDEGKGCDGL